MKNVETINEPYKIYKYQFEQPQLESEFKSVLIVEDDLSLRPLWEQIFSSINQMIKVDWAISANEAELLIRYRFKLGRPYNLVIADITLEGDKTGIDIWNKYGEETKNFVFVSGSKISKFELHRSLDFGFPPFFQKPLSAKICLEIANLLNYKKKLGGYDVYSSRN